MHKLYEPIQAPVIVLLAILGVFFVSRAVTYLILVQGFLPNYLFATINGFRLHHFVYGNFLVLVTGFMAVVLGWARRRNWLAFFYGIGLGLILDEFLLWVGDVRQLQSNVLWVPHSLTALLIATLILILVIYRRVHGESR